MSTLERAIMIAAEAHRGDMDKGGEPYILHPLRVMLSLKGTTARTAAVLHDVVEDTRWTLEALREEGFGSDVVDAVDALTRRDNESYQEFVRGASEHPVARRVKISDIEDNLDLSRIPEPSERDHRRKKRYKRALRELRG